MKAIADTGFLVAMVQNNDEHHRWAIELAPQTGDGDMIPIIQKRIELYANEKAYHAPLTRPRRL